jgi:hypothetical protein
VTPIELTFKTPLTEFQLEMLREAEARDYRKLLEDFEESQLYELTDRAAKLIEGFSP